MLTREVALETFPKQKGFLQWCWPHNPYLGIFHLQDKQDSTTCNFWYLNETFSTGLPSIWSAKPRHLLHFKSGVSTSLPFIPLHYLWIHASQLIKKIEFLWTPFLHKLHWYFPDGFTVSKFFPQIITLFSPCLYVILSFPYYLSVISISALKSLAFQLLTQDHQHKGPPRDNLYKIL